MACDYEFEILCNYSSQAVRLMQDYYLLASRQKQVTLFSKQKNEEVD